MAEARRSALYDAGKPKGESKSAPAAKSDPAPADDHRTAAHKKARDDMHKRHRTERRDMHGQHRQAHDDMHARHDKEIAAMDAQQDAAMMAPPGAGPVGPAPVAASANMADAGGGAASPAGA